MYCYVCQREPRYWCPLCDRHLCEDHGGERCYRCGSACTLLSEPGPAAGGLETRLFTYGRAYPSSRGYLQCETRKTIPTVYIDDDEPPSCRVCGRLARTVCYHCRDVYCPQHRSESGLCPSCVGSSRIGLIILAAIGAIALALAALHWLAG